MDFIRRATLTLSCCTLLWLNCCSFTALRSLEVNFIMYFVRSLHCFIIISYSYFMGALTPARSALTEFLCYSKGHYSSAKWELTSIVCIYFYCTYCTYCSFFILVIFNSMYACGYEPKYFLQVPVLEECKHFIYGAWYGAVMLRFSARCMLRMAFICHTPWPHPLPSQWCGPWTFTIGERMPEYKT